MGLPNLQRLVVFLVVLLLGACMVTPTPTPTVAPNAELPPDLRVELVASGLRSPTAMAFGPDGLLYVAQLNEGENAGRGQVVRIKGPDQQPEVLLEDLAKPTGLAWRDNTLFIVALRDLLMAERAADGLSEPIPLLTDLPSNGRSIGQITLLADGTLLLGVSGNIGRDGGYILAIDRANVATIFARGLKNPYDQVQIPASGAIYATEVSEEPINGQPPQEELNLLTMGSDHGWPRCDSVGQPVERRGGDAASCATTALPIATFPPHWTPTGLAFSDGNGLPAAYGPALYVALWNSDPPGVWRVPQTADGGFGSPVPFISNGIQPIDLLADPAGGLLVLDFRGGAIYRVVD
jgi:glucose/arabinose dehydrogenase